MIELANERTKWAGRCIYHLNDSPDLQLFDRDTFDFIYSNVALQHMHPTCSKPYLSEFLRVLKPGGVAVFQLPSELVDPQLRRDYEAIANSPPRPFSTIEMYGIPREEVIDLLKGAAAEVLSVEYDNWAGEEWIGFRYFVRKPAMASSQTASTSYQASPPAAVKSAI